MLRVGNGVGKTAVHGTIQCTWTGSNKANSSLK